MACLRVWLRGGTKEGLGLFFHLPTLGVQHVGRRLIVFGYVFVTPCRSRGFFSDVNSTNTH